MAKPEQSKLTFRQRHRIIYSLTLSLASILIACCLGLFYVIHFESGTALLWKTAKTIMGKDTLSGELVSGRLQDGIQIDDFRLHLSSADIQIDRFKGRWAWQWHNRTLTVYALDFGDINVSAGPSDDTPSEKLTLPKSLSLPVSLDLQDLSFDTLTIANESQPLIFKQLTVKGALTPAQHTLTVSHLGTPWGILSADAKVATEAPFNLSGQLHFNGAIEQQTFAVNSQLNGTLANINISADAQGSELIAGHVTAEVQPFQTMPLQHIQADIAHFNPKVLSPSAPEADFATQIELHSSDPETFNLAGTVSVKNNLPGPVNQDHIPVHGLSAEISLSAEQQTIRSFLLQLPNAATLKGSGEIKMQDGHPVGQITLQADKLNLNTLHQALHPTLLHGPVALTLSPETQQVSVNLQDNVYRLQADASYAKDLLTLSTVKLAAGKTALELKGQLSMAEDQDYQLSASLLHLDPSMWVSSKQPQANINGHLQAQGKLTRQTHLIQFNIDKNSRYGQIPLLGQGKIQLAGNRILPSNAHLVIADNQVNLKGSFGEAKDVLHVNVDAPNLALIGYGLSGRVKFNGTFSGHYNAPTIEGNIQADNVKAGDYALQRIEGSSKLHFNLNQKLNSAGNTIDTQLTLAGLSSPLLSLSSADISAKGSAARHELSLKASGDIHGKKISLSALASGQVLYQGATDSYGWEGIIQSLNNQTSDPQGLPKIHLDTPLNIHYLSGDIRLGATRLSLDNAAIELQQLTFNDRQISSAGAVKALDMRTIIRLTESLTNSPLPIRSNMIVNGKWDFNITHNATGYMELTKEKGDILINNGEAFIPMNLSDILLRGEFTGQSLRINSHLNSDKLGELSLLGTIGLLPDRQKLSVTDQSKLDLKLVIQQPSMAKIGNLYGPQLRLDGALQGQLSVRGSVGNPLISGNINGDQLSVSLLDQGISLHDGTIRLVLNNNVLALQQFEFHGGKGTLKITGQLDLVNPQSNLQAKAIADHLEIFTSPTRQLALSGNAILSNINRKLELDGKIKIDNALFDIPKSSAPSLDDDVVIVDSSVDLSDTSDPVPESAFIPRVQIDVDLGSSFYFKDAGADLQLSGILHVIREENQGLIGKGTINAYGVYEAFGTKLNIEQGLINFQGPLSNPDIHIRAMTQNQEVEAGVEVTGNANHPRVKLVSEPSVSDEEKLSWLMFGKGSNDSDISQTQAASQALAAIGTYGGSKIVQQIGLDQFSIGASDAGLVDDQVVSVGKSITRKISIGIEKALTGPDSVAKFTWNFSRRWSLSLRGGTVNGVSLTHNRRFD